MHSGSHGCCVVGRCAHLLASGAGAAVARPSSSCNPAHCCSLSLAVEIMLCIGLAVKPACCLDDLHISKARRTFILSNESSSSVRLMLYY